MSNKTFLILLIAVGAFSLLRIISQWRGVARRKRGIDWDEQFIQNLRKAGVDTFAPHLVDFFFTLPSRAACEQVAFALRPDGFSLDIKEDDAGGFSLHAQKSLRLIIPEMQALTARFAQLAEQHGGKYDNWAVARR
ncbi:MAG TPA: ribonuclease E inhibitor RraB [Steroidobacteraceae bacterium]|nr:ribonuclease E inhibitor RraB [Steroidobacteraceae bacterium]